MVRGLARALDQIIVDAGGPAWNEHDHAALVTRMHDELPGQIRAIAWTAQGTRNVGRPPVDSIAEAETLLPAVADLTAQRDQLVYDGFIAAVGADRLTDIARYLEASHFRLERLADTAAGDRRSYAFGAGPRGRACRTHGRAGTTVGLEELAWDLQELRISLFAQSVGVRQQVSVKRIRSALEAIRQVEYPGASA